MRYPRYPAYQDSGVDWLGEIPAHWEMANLKYLLQLEYGDSLPADSRQEGCVPVFGSNGPVGTHSKPNTLAPALIIGRKGSYGKVNFSDQPVFAIDTTYYVDSRSTKADLRWLYYTLQLLQLDAFSQDSAVPGLSREFVYQQRLPKVSLLEQRAIAAFLDRQTAKIDALISEQRHLIELLQERRAALITYAVTKGIDPAAPMQDSGIPWLGEIPRHWEVVRLKFVARVQSGVAKGRNLEGKQTVELPYLRVANVQSGFVDLSDVATITIGKDEIARYSLRAGDILMTEGGDYDKLGRGTVWEGQIHPCVHQNHIFAVRAHGAASPYWISALTQADYARHYFILHSKQSTNLASISMTNIIELPVILPPTPEQDRILSYLDRETAKIDALIAEIETGIAHLEEYRTALISAAVTGKIDVRNALPSDASAQLPLTDP